jgi:uncharacterized protein YegL
MPHKKGKSPGKALVYFLLDTSGSMQTKWTETIQALDAFVRDQQRVDEKAAFVLAQFDSPGHYRSERFEDIRDVTDPALLAPSDPMGGSTALFDATMESLSIVTDDKAERRALIILTDGEENNSHEWAGRGAEVRDALARAEKDGVGVMFLAVGPDAWANQAVFARHLTHVASTPAAAAGSVAHASHLTRELRCCMEFSSADFNRVARSSTVDSAGRVSESS